MQIPITIRQNHVPNAERAGTFTAPWPKVKVLPNTHVEWQIIPAIPGHTFQVTFLDTSPFAGTSVVDDNTGALAASNIGEHHYSVSVIETATGKEWKIGHCPELDVGG